MASIGATLRALREKRGWTQGELADRIDRSAATVSKIEAARQLVDVRTFSIMCDALGTSGDLVLLKVREGTDKTPFDRQITAIFRKALSPKPTTRRKSA